jgi:hypothetical protein
VEGNPFIEDTLRRRWLLAIDQMGPEIAAEDAANAFSLRLGCSLDEGKDIVRRAWQTLGLRKGGTSTSD